MKNSIENHYRNDPAKLAEWLTASHIERRKSNTSNSTPNNPPAPPPTT